MCSRDTSDYIQLEVPADEDLLAFPPNPPNSPAATTKLAFKDNINFIIPKLKKKSGYTGKTCIKHHSILCRICPLLKRARIHRFRILHKRLQTASTAASIVTNTFSSVSRDSDPYSARNPKNFSNDPKNSVDDPFSPRTKLPTASVDTVHTIHTDNIKINNTVAGPSTSHHHIDFLNQQSGSTTCSSCATCCCPRGNYNFRNTKPKNLGSNRPTSSSFRGATNQKGSIPSLLDLPFIVPPKYHHPLLNHL